MILRGIITQENTILYFYSQHTHRCYRQFQYFQTRVSRTRNWLTRLFIDFFTTEKLEDRISQQMKLQNIIRPSYIQQQAIRNKSGSAYHGGNNPCSA